MATQLTLTTELKAVNTMLGTILEAPINSLLGISSGDAHVAVTILAEKSLELQSRGWPFNTEVAMRLAADAFTGEVILPTNCMEVDTTGEDKGLDLVARGNRLYDRRNHTYKIGKSVIVDMTILLPFDELPETARKYIAVLACIAFQARQVGSTYLDAFTTRDEVIARRGFLRAMGKSGDYNIFNSPDMQRMLRRS